MPDMHSRPCRTCIVSRVDLCGLELKDTPSVLEVWCHDVVLYENVVMYSFMRCVLIDCTCGA